MDEGDDVEVTVKLDKDPERELVIPLTTSDQDPTSVQDYSGVPVSVTFQSGDIEKRFTVFATQDNADDDGDAVILGFGSPLPSQVTPGTTSMATVRIGDDDHPNVTVNFEQTSNFDPTSYSVEEGNQVAVYVTLSAEPGADGACSDRPRPSSDGASERRLRHRAGQPVPSRS